MRYVAIIVKGARFWNPLPSWFPGRIFKNVKVNDVFINIIKKLILLALFNSICPGVFLSDHAPGGGKKI